MSEPHANTAEHITWGLSRSLAGVGETLPVEVTVMTLGRDVAIVCLPGEVFVELGLAIKQGSPFRTTLVVELSNCVETIYIPHRAAYARAATKSRTPRCSPAREKCSSRPRSPCCAKRLLVRPNLEESS